MIEIALWFANKKFDNVRVRAVDKKLREELKKWCEENGIKFKEWKSVIGFYKKLRFDYDLDELIERYGEDVLKYILGNYTGMKMMNGKVVVCIYPYGRKNEIKKVLKRFGVRFIEGRKCLYLPYEEVMKWKDVFPDDIKRMLELVI